VDLLLNDRIAIVTGGASNIGRQVALTLAQEGANVAILDLDETGAQRVAQEAKTSGGQATGYGTNIADPAMVKDSVDRVVQDLGKIDILANVAGWMFDELFLDETLEKQEKVVGVNLWGPMNMIRAVLPHMVTSEYGRVISVASDAGRMGEYKEAVYSACKAGVIALSKALAREVGRYNITLNCVCPGLTIPEAPETISAGSFWHENLDFWTDERQQKATRAYPLRRLGKPGDVANMVAWLASDRCSYVTGQTVSVSGGYTMM
jgi:2-hydroxycyclohexanecarboxyl-CoA dehydrogenase